MDDLLVTGNNQELINQVRKDMQEMFKVKDLGELKFFLGIEIARSHEGIVLCQRKYALELISEAGLSGAKPANTPLETNLKLTSVVYDKAIQHEAATGDDELKDPAMYQRLVGRLLYLTMTRPDIAFVVQVLSQYMHCPKKSHMDAALRVVRYIKGTPGLGLFMPAKNSNQLSAYCDSDWGACLETRRSVTGYLVKFGGAMVSWKAKKQETVSRSSAEAEFRRMAACTAELTWLTGPFKELGVHIQQPIDLKCDSKAAIQIAANPIFHERTKHIDIDCHFVRERVSQGIIRTDHVSTTEQLADILTKGSGRVQHEYLISKLGLRDIFKPSA
nr:uncharacterized protein LOC112940244 [Solanum lycopersicum]